MNYLNKKYINIKWNTPLFLKTLENPKILKKNMSLLSDIGNNIVTLSFE